MRWSRRSILGAGAASLAAVAGGWGRVAWGRRGRGAPAGGEAEPGPGDPAPPERAAGRPTVISTWRHGVAANEEAMRLLAGGAAALDAVEAGVRICESDPEVMSVGYGGRPNRDGVVQLDAAIMDGPTARGGCVGGLEDIENPISVARKVMELTPHVLLVGEGARRFALEQGFPARDLLTDAAREQWERWRAEQGAEDPDGVYGSDADHDTIAMCALDGAGHLATACTTSGLAWKLPGRVGDSPILGAGSYVDDEVGAAGSTGVGEEVLQTLGSFAVVENMRRGMAPREACADAVDRILRKHPDAAGLQVAYIALRVDGAWGAFAIRPGFQIAVHDGASGQLLDVESRVADGAG